jgi:hypothetical protein
MKSSIFILISSTVLCCCVSNSTKRGDKANSVASESKEVVNYKTEVLPILQKKCSPCHFEGGKMYEKMPFDNSVTILNHEAGILKRIKDQPEADIVKQFVLQRKNGK